MNNTVYYNYQIMKEYSEKIKKERDQIKTLETDMDAIIQDLSRALEGECLLVYQKSHDNLKKQYRKLDEILNSLNHAIIKAKDQMDETDRRLAKKANTSFNEYIK